jgi:hypothetical protein
VLLAPPYATAPSRRRSFPPSADWENAMTRHVPMSIRLAFVLTAILIGGVPSFTSFVGL